MEEIAKIFKINKTGIMQTFMTVSYTHLHILHQFLTGAKEMTAVI